nr:MAG TPA: hypothetical protein [Caudoviricetes sp.]
MSFKELKASFALSAAVALSSACRVAYSVAVS